MVAGAVAVLGTVEHRRSGVRDEEVHRLPTDPDRHVPMGLRGQPEDLELLGRVPVCGSGRRRVVGQHRTRHVLPQEVLEGADVVGVDGVLRVDHHAELPLERPEPERVVATADGAVVVEVEAAGDAGVGRRDVGVGVVHRRRAVVRNREVVGTEQVDRSRVVVELVDQEDVGIHPLDGLGDVLRLQVARRGEIGRQLPGGAAVQGRVERREPDGVVLRARRARVRGDLDPQQGCEQQGRDDGEQRRTAHGDLRGGRPSHPRTNGWPGHHPSGDRSVNAGRRRSTPAHDG